jgi:hypothetical protein
MLLSTNFEILFVIFQNYVIINLGDKYEWI